MKVGAANVIVPKYIWATSAVALPLSDGAACGNELAIEAPQKTALARDGLLPCEQKLWIPAVP